MNIASHPFLTVDIVIELVNHGQPGPVILIKRRSQPWGWALPGGFVEYGESVEQAAIREVREETGLTIELVSLLGVYSNPKRDPRQHNISVTFAAFALGEPRAGDDAAEIATFNLENIPSSLCFDHNLMLLHYQQWRARVRSAAPIQFWED